MPEVLVRRPSTTREEFARELLAFITGPLSSRRRTSVVARVDAATPLFECGLIDSLGIIDLLAFVEATTGKRIPMRQIDMRHFGTVDRMVQAFWPETGVVES